jgi:hypothetical protein
MNQFIIFALPRSRTAWTARFLTYGGWFCGHDELQHMRSLADIASWCSQPLTGTVETGASHWWRLLDKYAPETKVAVIRRPVPEVMESLRKVGCAGPGVEAELRRQDRKLDQIEKRIPGALPVAFADLAKEDTCARLFEHCLPFKHDHAWWEEISPVNIQIHFPALMRYCTAYKPQLDKLGAMATQKVRSGMTFRRTEPPPGMTFQVEPFRTSYPDAVHLFREHLARTDQRPDDFSRKNIPLIQKADDLGMAQVLTARSNGRMFGYLLTFISPTFDNQTEKIGTQSVFFASPDCPGLGLKLQRESLRLLKEKGVHEVQFRDARREGLPVGTLFRRVGAQPFGEMLNLRLD